MDREKISLEQEGTLEKGISVCDEDDGPRSSPAKDLAAAAAVAALSLFMMIIAVRMPNPARIYTHPGLLPFIIGFTLLLMAAGLGIRAFRMGGANQLRQAPGKNIRNYFANIENNRTLLVIAIITVYVILVDVIAFDLRLPTGFFVFHFSSYELISIITLTVILRIFWRASLTRCFLVSAGWIIALVSVFRYAFHILLPGLG